MNFTTGSCNAIGEIEYNKEVEEWCSLNSTFLNEKTHLLMLNLLIQMKRRTYKHMIEQRSLGQYFSLQPSITEFHRKITLS